MKGDFLLRKKFFKNLATPPPVCVLIRKKFFSAFCEGDDFMSDFTNGYVFGGATDIYHKAVDDAAIIAGTGNLWGSSHHTTETYDSGTTSTTDTRSTSTSTTNTSRTDPLYGYVSSRENLTSNTTISMTDYD